MDTECVNIIDRRASYSFLFLFSGSKNVSCLRHQTQNSVSNFYILPSSARLASSFCKPYRIRKSVRCSWKVHRLFNWTPVFRSTCLPWYILWKSRNHQKDSKPSCTKVCNIRTSWFDVWSNLADDDIRITMSQFDVLSNVPNKNTSESEEQKTTAFVLWL